MTTPLSLAAASAAVEALGWRLLLGTLHAAVRVASLHDAVAVAGCAIDACGTEADAHLRVDVRPDRVEMMLQTQALGTVTGDDVDLARRINLALDELGASIAAPASLDVRPVQRLEIAIDTMDAPRIRPFWKAVLGYRDEPGTGPAGIIDPDGQGPAFWFQQLDEPREQRNRIHFDIAVAHDEALGRIRAAIAAGGVLVSDAEARAFWILADADGNEICVCTWQDRDAY